LNANSDNEVYAKFDDEGVSDRAKSLAEVINLISDDKSLLIYKTIFLASGDSSENLRTQLKLTRKQYYSRISRLTKAGLVKRQKGRYFVTSFGKVIYEAQRLLESAVKNLWSLKAIDSLGVAIDDNVPKEERVKIINLMISNPQIKEILLSAKF
jgi:DNA-binding HxlR family transcriptional regulator